MRPAKETGILTVAAVRPPRADGAIECFFNERQQIFTRSCAVACSWAELELRAVLVGLASVDSDVIEDVQLSRSSGGARGGLGRGMLPAPAAQGGHVPEQLDAALISRLREVLRSRSASEGELRTLGEQADGWSRALAARIRASEHRLQRLEADPASPLADIAAELRLLDSLRAETVELSSLTGDLDRRAHELRAEWLSRQAASPRGGR